MTLLALLLGLAAFGLGLWLRERAQRDAQLLKLLDFEVKALREEIRKISAPSQPATPVSSSAVDAQRATADFSSKGEEGPAAVPAPPVAFTPPALHPSQKGADAAAPAPPIDFAAALREGAEEAPVLAPPAAARAGFDWESFVGVKLFSWIAGVFLTIGAVLFLRYSIDRGWLSPPVQMAIGLFAGLGLLAVPVLIADAIIDKGCRW